MPSLPTSSFISCIACASPSTLPVAEIPPTAIDTNRIWPSRTEALSAAKAPINLTYCTACGHVFNRDYNDDLVNYEDDYENSQMFSPKFRKYCEELSDRLITNYNVYRKHVVEIGGGKGDFLRIICDRGNNIGVSFGPSYRPSPGDDIPANVSFVTDYYTEKYAGEPADLIICRHVLEHSWEPRGIITTVRQAIADRRDLVVYFEVPNGDFILREQAFWDFCYQHCSYFTKTSLTKMFIEHGFEVREVREDFGGQFLAIEAGAAADDIAANGYTLREGEEATAAASWQAFGADFNARAASWRDNLERLRAEGQRVIAWGAGAKAVTFLNIVDPAGDAISHIVDINPRKMGCFVSSSGQEIVAPNALQELRPKVILLMNAIYRDEIGSAVRALGLDPLFLVA